MMNNISTIQALRFIAALLVVITHATGTVFERLLNMGNQHFWRTGLVGVDIFFVISGFIMFMISSKKQTDNFSWKNFLLKRILRVAPLYWLAKLL